MPATGTDIAAATRDVVVEQWSSGTIAARYPSARDGLADPANGYFDDPNDAQTVINARGALIGTERRRFSVVVADVIYFDPSAGYVPTATLVDPEQATSGDFLISRIEVDLESETTTLELFG